MKFTTATNDSPAFPGITVTIHLDTVEELNALFRIAQANDRVPVAVCDKGFVVSGPQTTPERVRDVCSGLWNVLYTDWMKWVLQPSNVKA